VSLSSSPLFLLSDSKPPLKNTTNISQRKEQTFNFLRTVSTLRPFGAWLPELSLWAVQNIWPRHRWKQELVATIKLFWYSYTTSVSTVATTVLMIIRKECVQTFVVKNSSIQIYKKCPKLIHFLRLNFVTQNMAKIMRRYFLCLPKSPSLPLSHGVNISFVPLVILEIFQKENVLGILDHPICYMIVQCAPYKRGTVLRTLRRALYIGIQKCTERPVKIYRCRFVWQ
jgi:hypothetical protein